MSANDPNLWVPETPSRFRAGDGARERCTVTTLAPGRLQPGAQRFAVITEGDDLRVAEDEAERRPWLTRAESEAARADSQAARAQPAEAEVQRLQALIHTLKE
ncbi:MAG: hypothetical protein AAFZ18_24080 [Myxococcota bacterium]